ncbi:hypothetical protein EJ08DRAFT_628085 [Tothia fuscella]|uniref:Esterase n=1 Tax=Tothia fuscella TaxID=1048955 RepID=A0A9P4NZK4_9PEZI|nr:hypothetical protein EJ08DRAFT_628085 [Tothia fuscella]
MISKTIEVQPATLPNTSQYVVSNSQGDFLVQVAWPLHWDAQGVPPTDDLAPQTLFLVDGNAYFFTAVDITRRMEYLGNSRTVVVGIGYSNPSKVYDHRRGPDLTPASVDGEYEMPLDKHGKSRTDLSFGKALEHLDLIRYDIMDYVFDTLLPMPGLRNRRKALFGHSYGGIFALYTLFTAPALFDTVIAASPITWWNRSFLTEVMEPAFRANGQSLESPPSLFLPYGGGKQDLVQQEDEAAEAFQKRRSSAENEKMTEEVLALAKRMRSCSKIRKVLTHQFVDEDHGSVAATSLQMGVIKFLRQEI